MAYRGEKVPFTGAGLYLPLAGGTMNGDILVQVPNTIDLGSSTNYWRAIYAAKLDLTGALAIGTIDATQIDIGNPAIPTVSLTGAQVNIGDAGGTTTIDGTVNIGNGATTSQVFGTLRYDNVAGAAGASSGTYWVVDVGGAPFKIDLLNP